MQISCFRTLLFLFQNQKKPESDEDVEIKKQLSKYESQLSTNEEKVDAGERKSLGLGPGDLCCLCHFLLSPFAATVSLRASPPHTVLKTGVAQAVSALQDEAG